MNIFLTGATGYIGSRVAQRLTQHGHTVTALARTPERAARLQNLGYQTMLGDLTDPASLVTPAQQADGVIHTAFNHATDFFEGVEVERGVMDALLSALRGSGKPLVASNGSGILGDTGTVPVDEHFSLPADWPVAERGQFEQTLQQAANEGVRTSVLRIPILAYGHGESQLVPLLINTARDAGAAYYVGDGDNRLSSAHVDDIADLYLLALERAPGGSIYNVAVGESVAARDLAEAICQLLGGETRAQSVTFERAGEIWNPFLATLLSMNNQLSADKAMQELGWQPKGPSLLDDIAHGSYRQATVV
ncbi:SDR family oxidoreductase [Deinococcus sp.]|uniref:SDR family oxidoreductase n=1 Tax=Deinococcus sp. TaxID=47478 RepID=UPI003CC5FC11